MNDGLGSSSDALFTREKNTEQGKGSSRQRSKSKGNGKGKLKYWNCGINGHVKKDCTNSKAKKENSDASSEEANVVTSDEENSDFYGNIPFDYSQLDLLKIFKKFGKVLDVFIPNFLYSGHPRGYAFIRFLYEVNARAAMGVLDGQRIDGRVASIKLAKPRRPSLEAKSTPNPVLSH
ncbi:RNA-binding protein CP31B, chloroplastic-like [Magnolia sinica]|uniref:RNA-binding protein CP31B, chloroplastic-like n=1 Tax=Magnolia sinica TaxID=86752 RepID=UPI00265AF347|nr:RNA-binding protein CP31B, chloroplastic-like [Magnolia sinica]